LFDFRGLLRKVREVKKLAAGPGVHICDECVDVRQGIMQGEGAGLRAFDPATWPKERLLAVLGPVDAAAHASRENLQELVDALRAQDVSWRIIANS
jgi:ATP-dependent protease Clp ATPase subunit